jgi:hydroxymethylpyrimidine kinase / phosphomethylpyrimidine kinase / thiamine-phosphate diphosphorylase
LSRLFAFVSKKRINGTQTGSVKACGGKGMPGFTIRGVYLITDQGDHLSERVQSAISGGITALQYRNKRKDDPDRFTQGMELKELCARAKVRFFVNDDLELAKALDADGVHLGQEDGDPAEARRLLGAKKIIGVSTHNLSEALRAEAEGADYIGLGAMYPSTSKEIQHLAGVNALTEIRAKIRIPIVAIGGINRDNATPLIDSGADAVAVIAAVLGNREPGLAAAEMSLLFNRKMEFPRGKVLTVAGSDSGGGPASRETSRP